MIKQGINTTWKDVDVDVQRLAGPTSLIFMEVFKACDRSADAPRWKHIPDDVQEAVEQWIFLFCIELSELGYCVSQKSVRVARRAERIFDKRVDYMHTYCINVAQ